MPITEEIVEQIKKDAQAGMQYPELAKKYKLNIKDLSKIIKGEEFKMPPPGKPTLTEEGLIEYTLTLPAQAFAYFSTAKQPGLIKDHYIGQKVKLFRRPSHWLINYIALVNGLNCRYLLNNAGSCDSHTILGFRATRNANLAGGLRFEKGIPELTSNLTFGSGIVSNPSINCLPIDKL